MEDGRSGVTDRRHRRLASTMSTKIKVADDGPYLIEGEFEVVDPQGGRIETTGRKVVALCRCGQSASKPFCDGTHTKGGFRSTIKGA